MYNRNINRLTAVIQSPIAPRSTNVLWDDLVSNTLKVYRKGIWTVIGGAGGGGEGSSLYWGYDDIQGVIFPLDNRSVQINGDLTVNGDITARKLSVAELEIDGEPFASYWELDSNTNTLSTTYQVLIKNSLVVEQDTSSGGEGQDTPSAGLDEEQLQDYLDLHKYVTEDDIAGLIPDADLSDYYTKSQSDARYLALSGGVMTGDIATKSFWSGTDNLGVYVEGLSHAGLRFQYQKENGNYDQLLMQEGVLKFNSTQVALVTSNITGHASSATKLYASDTEYAFDSAYPYYLKMRYNVLGDNSWYLSVYPENPLSVSVDKAKQLVTPRTIWGQSFDGAGDVLAMNGVGLMSSKSYYYGLSILPMGSPYLGVRTFLTYDQGSTMGAYEIASRNAYGLTISHSGGVAYDFGNIPSDLSYDVLVNIRPNGNVGIGTTSPSYKLDVNGRVKANAFLFDVSHNRGIYKGSQYSTQYTYSDIVYFADNHYFAIGSDYYGAMRVDRSGLSVSGYVESTYNRNTGMSSTMYFTSTQWLRIWKGPYGSAVRLQIGKNYYHLHPMVLCVDVSVGYSTAAISVTCNSDAANTAIQAIRVTKDTSGNYYIDVLIYNYAHNTDEFRVCGNSELGHILAFETADNSATVLEQISVVPNASIISNNLIVSGDVASA